MFLFYYSLLALFLVSAKSLNFVCPQTTITNIPINGTIPTGATTLTNVPANNNCTIKFNIPNGYAVKLLINNSGINGSDAVTVVDTVGKSHQTQPNVTNAVIWLASGSASMNIRSNSGSLLFYATYQYVSLSKFYQQRFYTGSYFPANLSPNTVYTISSRSGIEKVAVTIGKRGTMLDSTIDKIYVYDGDNILNSTMIGRLSDLIQNKDRFYSSGNSISFVCFYDQGIVRPVSYIIGNDASAVRGLQKYKVSVLAQGDKISSQLATTSLSAYTFICAGCDALYLDKFSIDNLDSSVGSAEFRGQTPTRQTDTLIKYESQTFHDHQIPQIIHTSIFTMYVNVSTPIFTISTNPTKWNTPYDKRSGVIISPNKWAPSVSASFSYTFRDDSNMFIFDLFYDKTVFVTSDSLTVKVGPTNGNTINNIYTPADPPSGTDSAKGNYMTVALDSASYDTDVRLHFTMNGSASTFIVITCLYQLIIFMNIF